MSVAVVTAIYGGYDTLKPAGTASDVEWVCVTDDQKLRDEPQGWHVIYEPRQGVHPNRAAKRPKMLPWCYTGADSSVWIDASYQVIADSFTSDVLALADPIAQFAHPDRDCIYDEAAYSATLTKYRGQYLDEQAKHYRALGHPERWGLWATGVIARHHTEAVIDFGWRWLADCECFTCQDQVSEAPALAHRTAAGNAARPLRGLAVAALRAERKALLVTHVLEIGQGHLIAPGWEHAAVLDPMHGHGDLRRLAQDVPWPIGTGTVERIRASHVMEHIPSGAPRIAVMNEAHRVLWPGGTFEIVVPGEYGTWHPIADPTHVSRWVLESFHYFDGTFAANADYGIALWETITLNLADGWEVHWLGRKP